MTCSHCSLETPEDRNFCVHCKHKLRDLRGIRFGKGTGSSVKLDYFWETGNPAVFASPGALDFDPSLP